MDNNELLELGRSRAKKTKNLYIGFGISLLILGIIMIIMGISEKNKDPYQYISAAIALSIGAALVALIFVTKNNILNDDKMIELGKKVLEKQKKADEKKVFIEPDLQFDKEFVNEKNKVIVWINTSSKEMQFVYPIKKKLFNGWKYCEKTKILKIENMKDFDLLHDVKEVERSYGGTSYGESSSSSHYTRTTDEYHYYAISMKFNDLDLPYLELYFGSEGKQATLIYETIKILWDEEDSE